MAINFPDSPVNGSTYDYQGIRYTYVVTGSTGYWRVITAGNTGSATVAEIDAGLIDNKYVTPLGLEGSKYEAGLHADGVSYDNSDGALDATATTVQAAIRAVLDERPNPNLLINGDFQVWQRGTSFPEHPTGYTADRWYSPGPRTANQSTDVPPNTDFTLSGEFTTGTSTYSSFRQPVELAATGEAGIFRQGETFTLSGWVKIAEVGRNLNYTIRFADDAALTNEVRIVEPAVFTTGDGTWQYVTKTFTVGVDPLPTNTCVGLFFYSDLDGVQTTVTVTGFKLERGSVATRFEVEPYGDVLRKCQRYFEKSSTHFPYPLLRNTSVSTASDACAGTRFMVQKRAAASIKIFSRQETEGWVSKYAGSVDDAAVLTTSTSKDGIDTLNFDRELDVDVSFRWEADAEL